MRAPRNFDKLISRSLSAVNCLSEGGVGLPAAGGSRHASEWGLAKPRQFLRVQGPTGVRRRTPTIEELALESLRRKMAEARMVKPVQLANYVARHLNGRRELSSSELTIGTINDLCCYQRLLLMASRSECPPELRRHDPMLMLRGLIIELDPSAQTRNAFMEHRAFRIQRERA